MRKLIWVLFILIMFGITYMLVISKIGVGSFMAISSIWFLIFAMFYFEPETIKKIAIWKLTIERDVTVAQEIKNQVSATAEELRKVTKLIIEDTYIIASSSTLAMVDSPARSRLEKNLGYLSRFVEPDKENEDAWWGELNELYKNRQKT
ncbi:hypothetical protein CYQ88_11045 [Hydrogenovibrio sp. SC-1]|uniref:hypothetical protein n=1 Tax=Hydrogenovibrio sp. SC-1 TaxID=2065820 RepID=UPI000C79ACA0|nr:hypothetical protein [Hydrogenovibrio sp. SC-1]PLA73466.1 hypothetical protein CYQ88_11045 [Hydrogenovibrio sp. SC-1]